VTPFHHAIIKPTHEYSWPHGEDLEYFEAVMRVKKKTAGENRRHALKNILKERHFM